LNRHQEDHLRKVCVVLVDRANYGRLKPVIGAIKDHPSLHLQLVATGTMVLERFDSPVNIVRNDGFDIEGEIYIELEGSTPATMAKSIGFGLMEFASEFQRLKPDVLLLIGDRYEALAAAIAAAYMNICLLHVQGGEVSGSIDESARHAITKFAHYHYPSTHRAAEYIVRMGEDPSTILGVGCPSSDIARTLNRKLDTTAVNGRGSGATIDVDAPYQLVIFHPTTTDFGSERQQMYELLEALRRLGQPTIMLWPNIDAGADHVSKAIRVFRERFRPEWLRILINLPPDTYLRVLAGAACAIGNSSSFVRDASFFGTPVVLVGDRQKGRETDEHVVRVAPVADEITQAVVTQLGHGPYSASQLYGNGFVAEQIAAALATIQLYRQKRLHFIYDEVAASDEMPVATQEVGP
jgi:UDP-hydrolysing UDP-N-acetyl-D-glucosamine 2-epimerase